MTNTVTSPLELFRLGFLEEVNTGALLNRKMVEEIRRRHDGYADAFCRGHSRRLVKWPFPAHGEGEQ